MPQKPNEQSAYQFWKKDKKQGEMEKLEESVPVIESAQWPTQPMNLPPAEPTITLSDYKAHILGWHHGASGQSPDWSNMSDNPQYRTGFDAGRKTRNDYARALKRRVQ